MNIKNHQYREEINKLEKIYSQFWNGLMDDKRVKDLSHWKGYGRWSRRVCHL